MLTAAKAGIEIKKDIFAESVRLKFKNLAGYDYFNVPLHLFDGLRDSDSKGRFINKYIIGEFKLKCHLRKQ